MLNFRNILLIALAWLNSHAEAIPLPHTFPLTPANTTANPVDPLLQDWLDEHSGV